MNKIIAIVLFFVIMIASVGITFAENKASIAMYAPEWEEFCPALYIDARYVAADAVPDIQKNFPITKRQQFLDRSIIFRPFVVHNLSKHIKAQRVENYWAQRRMIFDNESHLMKKI